MSHASKTLADRFTWALSEGFTAKVAKGRGEERVVGFLSLVIGKEDEAAGSS